MNKRHKSGVSHVIFGYELFNGAIAKKIDVSFYRKTKMAAVKTEAAISFQRVETIRGYQLLDPYFRSGHDVDMILSTLINISDLGRPPNYKWRPPKPKVETITTQ